MLALRGSQRRMVATAHLNEWFARQNPLKPMDEYWQQPAAKAAAPNFDKQNRESLALIAMLHNLKARGAPVTITQEE